MKDLGEEERMLPRMLLINSPMGPGDEMIVPGDLEDSCNMVSSSSVDIVTVTVKVTLKVTLIFRLIVPFELLAKKTVSVD